MKHGSRSLRWSFGFALAALFAWGCGGGGSQTEGPPAEPGTVFVETFVHEDVPATDSDGLAPVAAQPAAGFSRALSHADWRVVERPELAGTTGDDGGFEIAGLQPGRYTLVLERTLNGRLVRVEVPFQVGENGSARVRVEVRADGARAVSRFPAGGTQGTLVGGPGQSLVAVEAGTVREIAGGGRELVDPDGDGVLEPADCPPRLWTCEDFGSCGADLFCTCVSSCPLCEDCGPTICAPPWLPGAYRCADDGSCAGPGEACVCVSSCPECDDCVTRVCVPACEPVEITALKVEAPDHLRVGQRGQATAWALLSDGRTIEVTTGAVWESSAPEVVSVDEWGGLLALSTGSAAISATLGDLSSEPAVVVVEPRGRVARVWVENLDCILPLDPRLDVPPEALPARPEVGGILPPPACRNTVRVGQKIHFGAFAEFADGWVENVTEQAQWRLVPASVGEVKAGLFVAVAPGTARLTAVFEGVESEAVEIRVVDQASVVALQIYPERLPVPLVDVVPPTVVDPVDPSVPGFPEPCPDCGWVLTVLSGDQVPFRAMAVYDTGEWEDVTGRVAWNSSQPEVATIDEDGVLEALEPGQTEVWAELEDVKSNVVDVRVVEEATPVRIEIDQEGNERVIAAGDQAFFRATAWYDVGFARDVTEEAVWHSSDPAVASFASPGVLTGHAAGTVQVWAELGPARSDELSIEVFVLSDIEYCDPEHINRSTWFDGFNRVTLESDCAWYHPGDVVTLRFTATEVQPRAGILDPCLDLYAYRGERLVRVIREEGCGDPFLPGAPVLDEEAIRYQLRAFWDLKDERGQPVEAGTYTIYGRFYLYFDPVVAIDVEVLPEGAPTPEPRPTPTPGPQGYTVSGHVAEFPPCEGSMRGVAVVLEGLADHGERIERVAPTGVDPASAGDFRFRDVPAGEYEVRVEPPCNPFGCWRPAYVRVQGDAEVQLCPLEHPSLPPTRGNGGGIRTAG